MWVFRRGRRWVCPSLVLLLAVCIEALEHNLPDNIELVDPKDLGLDSQFDLDKLLGNVKALPIDTNGLSAALGKPGLKTQVLTVGFDGSEGINLDDFELPHSNNDENAPLAQAAFTSFKNFFKNSSAAAEFTGDERQLGKILAPQRPTRPSPTSRPVAVQRPTGPGGKRRTMMKRRKVVRVNGTTTTPAPVTEPPQPVAAASGGNGPKVIELDSSQIEKLIASGKIGPPKSITPGGPQVIELGQSELDALLSGENADEIKQILEGGDTIHDFDISQLSGGNSRVPPSSNPVPRVVHQHHQLQQEDDLPVTTARITESRPAVSFASVVTSPVPTTTPPSTITTLVPTGNTEDGGVTTQTTTLSPPSSQSTTTGFPIIYQYSSSQDEQLNRPFPVQGIQGTVPLQFYSSTANGQQQARLVKTPTFEFISAPPVSFSSQVVASQVATNNIVPQQQPIFVQQQFQNAFVPQQQTQFVPVVPIQQPQQQQHSKPQKQHKDNFNKIIPAAQTSSHTEQVKLSSSTNSNSNNNNNNNNNNFINTLHKVNIPVNSVKLATPSPQVVHTVLNQVPASFQPSLLPNHVVSSPVLNPLNVNQPQTNFLRQSQPQPIQQNNLVEQPFRNTQLFSSSSGILNNRPAPSTRPPSFRFPTTSGILSSQGGPNRFRTAESVNPFFNYQPAASSSNGFGNLVLNSFVAGDGLNYRARSSESFQSPGI